MIVYVDRQSVLNDLKRKEAMKVQFSKQINYINGNGNLEKGAANQNNAFLKFRVPANKPDRMVRNGFTH